MKLLFNIISIIRLLLLLLLMFNNNQWITTTTSSKTSSLKIMTTTTTNMLMAANANDFHSAPYLMPFDSNLESIEDLLKNSNLKHFILAFVLASNSNEQQNKCLPTWNGQLERSVQNDQKIRLLINYIRRQNGDVSISFGGANGIELAHECSTVEQLVEAYQLVIDKYNLTYIDFDIEGQALGQLEEEQRRFDAIKILKQNAKKSNRKLFISLTLPTTRIGLNQKGLDEIQHALNDDPELIDLYNLMAFDFGGQANNDGEVMAQQVVEIMEIFHKQLKQLLQQQDDQLIFSKMGMILMNGHTDQPGELFTQKTFQNLINYAEQNGLQRISFWSINRDRSCDPNKNHGWVSPDCSSIQQQPYDFSKILATFNPKKKPTPSPSTTSSPAVVTTTTQTSSTETSTIGTTSDPDDDDIDCSKIPDGKQVYFPIKNNPHKFIECCNGQKFILDCPKNTVFDTKLHICVWE